MAEDIGDAIRLEASVQADGSVDVVGKDFKLQNQVLP